MKHLLLLCAALGALASAHAADRPNILWITPEDHGPQMGCYGDTFPTTPNVDALAKMTILPARRLATFVPAMKSKGRLAVGADADITIFDPATVLDRGTFEALPGQAVRSQSTKQIDPDPARR